MEKTEQEKKISNQLSPAISALLDDFGRTEYPGNYRYERFNYTSWYLYPKSRSEERAWCSVGMHINSDRFQSSSVYLFIDFRLIFGNDQTKVSKSSMKRLCENIHQATDLPIHGMVGGTEIYYGGYARPTID